MVGTTLPTPLYPLFEQRYSFGPLLVTVIFAIYAFGVIGGLILFGNLSDRLGRKPPLLLGLVLSAASAVLFLSPARSHRSTSPASSPGSRPGSSPGRRPRT